MAKSVKFTATILESGVGTGGAYVLFPYDVEKTFGSKGRIPVKATIDGESYRGSLVKYGSPEHMFPILKSIREKIGKKIGDTVDISLEMDTEERDVEIPKDFKKALKEHKLDKVFLSMSYSHRREWVQWIEGAKKEETRVNRIVKAIERLLEKPAKK